ARAERADFCSHDYAGPPCKRVFTSGPASVAAGAPCTADEECAPSPDGEVRCVAKLRDDDWVRVCQVQPTGALGDSPCVESTEADPRERRVPFAAILRKDYQPYGFFPVGIPP